MDLSKLFQQLIEVIIQNGPLGVAFIVLYYSVLKGYLVPRGMIPEEQIKTIAVDVAEIIMEREDKRRNEEYTKAARYINQLLSKTTGMLTVSVDELREALNTFQEESRRQTREHQAWSQTEFDRITRTIREAK